MDGAQTVITLIVTFSAGSSSLNLGQGQDIYLSNTAVEDLLTEERLKTLEKSQAKFFFFLRQSFK